jgi:uncharacterized protein (DUF2141 family)
MSGIAVKSHLAWRLMLIATIAFSCMSRAAGQDLLDLFNEVENAEKSTASMPSGEQGQTSLEGTQELTVRVAGLRSERGKVRVLVFDEASAYNAMDAARAVGYIEISPQGDSVSATIAVLGEGPYALFTYHDENEDLRLNMRGAQPLEGYAYSGATDPYVPPSFPLAAKVTTDVTLRLAYVPSLRRR